MQITISNITNYYYVIMWWLLGFALIENTDVIFVNILNLVWFNKKEKNAPISFFYQEGAFFF